MAKAMKAAIRKWMFALLIVSFLLSGAYAQQQWTKEVVPQTLVQGYTEFISMLIGDADNDNKNEIYSITEDSVVKHYWDSTTLNWNSFTLPISLDVPGWHDCGDGEIGDGDNDGNNEIS